MTWLKVDDQWWRHRKTRKALRSHPTKRRDAGTAGLWALAGSWSNDGFVPLEVLDEWDDDAPALARRLVEAGLWWETTQDGEEGFGFHDWEDHNPTHEPRNASKSGSFGNHRRWHEGRGIVADDCPFCRGDDRGDIAPDDRGESQNDRGRIAPVPSRPDPTRPDPTTETPSSESAQTELTAAPDRFGEFWEVYDHKVTRKRAETAWHAALAKPGVTADLVISAATAYVGAQRASGKHPQFTKHPTTWLHGECWNDEVPRPALTRSEQWLALGQRLHEEENA